MLALNPEPETPLRQVKSSRLLVLMLLVIGALLVTEKCRGESALEKWKTEMAAKGDQFDAAKIWPALSPESVEFTNRLNEVLKMIPRAWWNYGGQMTVIVADSPGQWRRGSQEPQPVFWYPHGDTNTWENLKALAREAEPGLQALRELMQKPPTGIPYNIREALESEWYPNFVNVRVGAQALAGAVMHDLHEQNINSALDNLVALNGFVKLYSDDPSLVACMIRTAIMSMSTDLAWDALQAGGWTDAQLVRLQSSRVDTRMFLSQLPRAFEATRAERLYQLDWFKSHSFGAFYGRAKERAEKFGFKIAEQPFWREWLFHPVWRAAWADEEEVEFLRDTEPELNALREATKSLSFRQLSSEVNANHEGYREPIAAWRFFRKLPGDELLEMIGGKTERARPAYPYTDLRRAWSVAMGNLTRNEMVLTAIVVKRYELKYGKSPTSLEALVSDFLATPPRDFMDGKPLRCRMMPEQTFAIYSVGSDFRDDGGNPLPEISANAPQHASPWDEIDWVWRAAVANGADAKISNAILRGSGEK